MFNNEEFSANLKEIEVIGSIEHPTEKWIQLGSLFPFNGEYIYKIKEGLNSQDMVRNLKVKMKAVEGNELYCTLTQIKVYGKGMHVVMRDSLMGLVKDQNSRKNDTLNRSKVNATRSNTSNSSNTSSVE